MGVDPCPRVPHRQAVAPEPGHLRAGQRQHRTGAQVHRVLRHVVDAAVRQRQHGVGVQRDAVAGDPVDRAVGEGRRRPGGYLHPGAVDLVDLAAQRLQTGVVAGDRQARSRRVVHPAAVQSRPSAAAHRDPGLPRRDHLALLEDASAAVHHGDADTGRVVDGAGADGGPPARADLDPRGGPGDDPQSRQFRGAVLDQDGRHRRVLPLDVQPLDLRGGPHRQRDPLRRRDPHRPGRPLLPEQRHRPVHHEVLPVRARGDGQDVTVGRGLEGGGEEAYSPVRRRHREVPVCVTWTVPCAMVLLCPHLVYAGPADCRRRSPAGPP